MRYNLDNFILALNNNKLNVKDELETTDIDGRAIFQVAEIRSRYVYMCRKYLLSEKYDKPHTEIEDFLNNDYLASLPADLAVIMGKRHGSRIFVPYFAEVFEQRNDCEWADQSKGRQWKIFKNTKEKIRLVENKYGLPWFWWLASPSIGYFSYFCSVSTIGGADYYAAPTSHGVLPCFKINRETVGERYADDR